MTLPQETTGFRLQPGVKVLPSTLASSSLNLSIVMTQAASRPAAPVITSSRAKARLPPTVRVTASGSASDAEGSGSVETSLTVVLLITPIRLLERWTFFGHRPLCRTRAPVHCSMDMRKYARSSRNVRFRPTIDRMTTHAKELAVDVRGLRKQYGDVTAVDGI